MKCRIIHESRHSMRVRMEIFRMTLARAEALEYYLRSKDYVVDVKVYDRAGDAVITFGDREARSRIVEALAQFRWDDPKIKALVPEHTGRALSREYEDRIWLLILGRVFRKFCLPVPIQIIWTVVSGISYILKGLKCLAKGKIEVPVLDAAAVTASMLRNDFSTAGSIMFLLNLGDLLEEWTHRKSVDDLARSITLKTDKVWVKTDGPDVLTDVKSIHAGDRIIIRTSNVIPLDGNVVEGTAMVNQAAMTGESISVEKRPGSVVYAGTVVETGECVVEVTKVAGSGRYDQIVRMIEDSEKLKSATETKAYHMADRLVPWSLAGTVITWLLTHSANRSLSFLMVDFSCALKLAMPLSVLSAMNEASQLNITVKGGKFLEAIAEADTIVFDKTGTLTRSHPEVVQIVPFDGTDMSEDLRLAACLEEHFPHSVANAVVEAAKKRGLEHREIHTKVQYLVAHGIASTINDRKIIIGSYHFVFEDEHCTVNPEEKDRLDAIPDEYTHLYLAYDGKLKAVLCIFDPIREEAPAVIDWLHELGVSKICMMTGDSQRTAGAVARQLKLDGYYAEVLPEDKASFIRREQEAGRRVIMLGDGINDTPALSEADAGIAVSSGAAIAREVADITISADSLYSIAALRELSMKLMLRININYGVIIGFNGSLIALGAFGLLMPATSALLHNISTIVIGLHGTTRLLNDEDYRQTEQTGKLQILPEKRTETAD